MLISFIGGGVMAEAIIKGIISSGRVSPEKVMSSDICTDRTSLFCKAFGISTTSDNLKLVSQAEIIILAVKPQIIESVLQEIAEEIDTSMLIISIAAGVPLNRIEGILKAGCRVVRVMPNTPALIGEGVSALSPGHNAIKEDMDVAGMIFGAVGKTVVVEEKYMDAVTGLSGSGPAYIFLIIEALGDAGVKVGLTRETARTLALQTVLGSTKMLLETGEHPAKLKDMVTSPGGTTIAGLHILEAGKIRAVIMDAVEAATKRSQELGRIS